MALSTQQTSIGAALIALLMASAGGAAFLHKHPNPTLREVFVACEKGDINGIVCCEDVSKMDFGTAKGLALTVNVKTAAGQPLTEAQAKQCGAIRPLYVDPLGFRQKEENDWDAELAREKSLERKTQ